MKKLEKRLHPMCVVDLKEGAAMHLKCPIVGYDIDLHQNYRCPCTCHCDLPRGPHYDLAVTVRDLDWGTDMTYVNPKREEIQAIAETYKLDAEVMENCIYGNPIHTHTIMFVLPLFRDSFPLVKKVK